MVIFHVYVRSRLCNFKIRGCKKEIQNLEDQLGGVAECGDIPFNHAA